MYFDVYQEFLFHFSPAIHQTFVYYKLIQAYIGCIEAWIHSKQDRIAHTRQEFLRKFCASFTT